MPNALFPIPYSLFPNPMIPIADNIRNTTRPIVVYVLIGIHLALFLWMLRLYIAGELGDFLGTWSVVPVRMHSSALDAIATNNPAAWVTLIVIGSVSLFWGMFLHGSVAQILGNMLFLWVFGKNVEHILGHGRFLGFYLLAGILAQIGQILIDPNMGASLVGANGAIAAILGAYLLSFPKAKIESVLPLVLVYIPMEIPAFFYLLWWFVQQLSYGIGKLSIVGGINPLFSIGYWSHGVGLIIGAALVPLLVKRKPPTAIY